jgi:hypothetical protein
MTLGSRWVSVFALVTLVFGAGVAAAQQPTPEQMDNFLKETAGRGTGPLSGKKPLKVTLTSPWKAIDKFNETATAVVTVFDQHNSKCWEWKKVTYKRWGFLKPGGSMGASYTASSAAPDVAEVPCASVGYTPPAIALIHVKNDDHKDHRVVTRCKEGEVLTSSMAPGSGGEVNLGKWTGCTVASDGGPTKPVKAGSQCSVRAGGTLLCE